VGRALADGGPRLSGGWPIGPVPARSARLSREELAKRIEALGSAPMFADLPKRHRQAIARVTYVRRFAPDVTLMEEGAPASSFLVILEGTAKVRRNGRTIARLGPGDFIGEISLLDPGPRTATVVATTGVTCLDLAGKDFRRILENQPALVMQLLKGLAHRFRATQESRVGSSRDPLT
jgi:CRP/FNR family transcriptional regulator, cyclic AMP receptor protein